MKLNPLETHDRLLHFKKQQSSNLFDGLEECRLRNKDCVAMQRWFPYVYIFAHPRTWDDGVTKRMIWQPRLSKPKAQTNSYLFRLTSNSDIIEIVWMIPPRELWSQYEEGMITASDEVKVSIYNFLHQRAQLEAPHAEDWSEERIKKKLKWIEDEQRQLRTLGTD